MNKRFGKVLIGAILATIPSGFLQNNGLLKNVSIMHWRII